MYPISDMGKMFIPLPDSQEIVLKEANLILPCVSVGNVGQLAVDLMISTLDLKKIGRLHSNCVLPVVGNDPFSENRNNCSLMTAVEVFGSRAHNIVVVQQRSPIIAGKKKTYMEQLVKWIKECQFKNVIILTSSHAHERLDRQLTGCQLRYLASEVLMEDMASISMNSGEKIVELEKRNGLSSTEASSSSPENNQIFIPGGGIAKSLFTECIEEKLAVGVILEFCAEGDNIPEAVLLASAAMNLLQKMKSIPLENDVKWKMPPSWNLMYGNQFEQVLYR